MSSRASAKRQPDAVRRDCKSLVPLVPEGGPLNSAPFSALWHQAGTIQERWRNRAGYLAARLHRPDTNLSGEAMARSHPSSLKTEQDEPGPLTVSRTCPTRARVVHRAQHPRQAFPNRPASVPAACQDPAKTPPNTQKRQRSAAPPPGTVHIRAAGVSATARPRSTNHIRPFNPRSSKTRCTYASSQPSRKPSADSSVKGQPHAPSAPAPTGYLAHKRQRALRIASVCC
jgi:hypothetical protein